jgi:hypothetical protein
VLEMEICRVNWRRDLEGGREVAVEWKGDTEAVRQKLTGAPPRVSDRWA